MKNIPMSTSMFNYRRFFIIKPRDFILISMIVKRNTLVACITTSLKVSVNEYRRAVSLRVMWLRSIEGVSVVVGLVLARVTFEILAKSRILVLSC